MQYAKDNFNGWILITGKLLVLLKLINACTVRYEQVLILANLC